MLCDTEVDGSSRQVVKSTQYKFNSTKASEYDNMDLHMSTVVLVLYQVILQPDR